MSILAIWIFPKLNMVALDMLPDGSAWLPTLFETSMMIAWVIGGLWMLLVFGNGLEVLLRRLHSSLPDAVDFLLPWRRKRMLRDFSMMLALLLDAGLPETKAVDLAAGCAANEKFRAQASRARRELENGVKLTDAVRVFGHTNEFVWRLRNAAVPSSGFVAALAGWHETLAAKAFQQQQTASQLVTTGFVFLNGLMVGSVALGLFQLLIAILEESVL
jgi:type II secretory pathway component PulF